MTEKKAKRKPGGTGRDAVLHLSPKARDILHSAIGVALEGAHWTSEEGLILKDVQDELKGFANDNPR